MMKVVILLVALDVLVTVMQFVGLAFFNTAPFGGWFK